MPLLLLCALQLALSLSQGLSRTEDHTSNRASTHANSTDKLNVEISTLRLSHGCSGVVSVNTTVFVTLNLLDAQEKRELALQICQRFGCGLVYEHNETATLHDGTCLANCSLRDSKLHNCTTAAKGDCANATEVTCEHHVVQLVGGSDRCAGRVELRHSGNWGTVCDDDFDEKSGNVVCDQLNCGRYARSASFGVGTGAIHISKIKCNGSESNLWECSLQNNTSNYCGHKEDVGIVCSESKEKDAFVTTSVTDSTTQMAAFITLAATEDSGGLSAAVIGCIILSIALLIFIILNVAASVHLQRTKECVIHQHHSNSHTSLESNERVGTYNTHIVLAPGAPQYESLGPRGSSNYGKRTGSSTAGADSSSDSDYEHHSRHRTHRALPDSSKDVNDGNSTIAGERYIHNVEINMDMMKSEGGFQPSLTPLSFVAPDIHSQAGDADDSSSTSSGEFYENTKTDMDNMPSEETERELSPVTPLSDNVHHLPGLDSKDFSFSLKKYFSSEKLNNKTVEANDSSSTSSGETYQNTESDTDCFKSREEKPSLHEKGPFPPSGEHYIPEPDNLAEDVNDSDSTSSGECYQNVRIESEDEESPSLPEQSLQTPHSAQMTGNTAGYSGFHPTDGDDSDSNSSEEYQNVQIDENTWMGYGEESPSFPETSFENPHIAKMTEDTEGYDDHPPTTNFNQDADNSSTASEASYVNVEPKKDREDDYTGSDYDDSTTW